MTDLMNFINNILWGSVLIYLLLGTGIYFTLRTRFIQLRHFSHMFSVLKNSNKSDSAGISLSGRCVPRWRRASAPAT